MYECCFPDCFFNGRIPCIFLVDNHAWTYAYLNIARKNNHTTQAVCLDSLYAAGAEGNLAIGATDDRWIKMSGIVMISEWRV
jgi:hypothetical protein